MNRTRAHQFDSADNLQKMIDAQKANTGFAMSSYFFQSELAYQRELDNVVFKSWLYAAHISELPSNGSYVLFEVGEESVIVNRDLDGEIRAFQNICRHRGSRVCEARSGKRKTFVCPYHGWTYNLDGSLRRARDMQLLEGFEEDDYGLLAVSVEVFMGLIFINLDASAPPFTPQLENIATPLAASGLDNAKLAHQATYQVDANWKLCLENYLECYHCANAHPKFARMHSNKALDDDVAKLNENMFDRAEELTGVEGIGMEYQRVFDDAPNFGACVLGGRYALYDGFLTGSEGGQPVAPLMGTMQGYDGGVGEFQMGPISHMLNYPDYCLMYRFIPRGINKTDMHVSWFVKGDAEEGVDYDHDKLIWLWHNTSLEDEFIIEQNAKGVNSTFFKPGPYHPEYEYWCIKFIDWYLDALV